jgi:hypothetical protein
MRSLPILSYPLGKDRIAKTRTRSRKDNLKLSQERLRKERERGGRTRKGRDIENAEDEYAIIRSCLRTHCLIENDQRARGYLKFRIDPNNIGESMINAIVYLHLALEMPLQSLTGYKHASQNE